MNISHGLLVPCLVVVTACPLFAEDWETVVSRDKTFSFSVPIKPDEDYEDDTIQFDAVDDDTDQHWIIVRLPYTGRLTPASRRDHVRDMFNYSFDPDGGDEILNLEETRLQTHRCMRSSVDHGTETTHQMFVLTKSYFYRFKTTGRNGVIGEKEVAKFFGSVHLNGNEAKSELATSRLWSDLSGKFQIEAEFVELKDNVVSIRKSDGALSRLPLNRLSKADAALVKKITSTDASATKKSREWILSSQHAWPDFFQRDGEAVSLPIGTVLDERHRTLIFSERTTFRDIDFDLEVLVSLVANPDGVCKIGLGDGESKSSLVLMLATPAPSYHKGLVQLASNVGGGAELGYVTDPGTHLLSIRKRKDKVLATIDVNHDGPVDDGPDDDDFQTVVADLSEFSPGLTNENARLFFGGGGIFHSIRVDFDPPNIKMVEPELADNDKAKPMKTKSTEESAEKSEDKVAATKTADAKTKNDSKRPTSTKKSRLPKEFAPSRDVVPVADGIVMKDRIKGVIVTKKGGYLEKDFVMEVVLSLPSDPVGVVNIGIGDMESKSTALIMMGTPSPSFHKGLIQVGNNIFGGEELGNIDQTEKRLVRVEKKGDEITFTLDVTMDGASDDDITKTIEDIREYAEKLDDNNSYLYFGGAGVFHGVTLEVGK